MKKLLLNSGWVFSHEDFKSENCLVPFSMYSLMLEKNYIDDPFYRDNEYKIAEMSNVDSDAYIEFSVDEDTVKETVQRLSFLGADTVIDVTLNGVSLGRMTDMHRRYDFDVKGILKSGLNRLDLHFNSSVMYTKKIMEDMKKMGMSMGGGHAKLRKVASMNGWDWGPRLPDMGIYKDVVITAFSDGELSDISVRQVHGEGSVKLLISAESEVYGDSEIKVTVTSPKGEKTSVILDKENKGEITISDPEIWWPHGYGSQPLYSVTAELFVETEKADEKDIRIGLRTIKLCTNDDEWGREFVFEVNGIRIFSMGANYIPEDNLIPRITKDTADRLIENCLLANFNMIRIWGGGYYLPDYFMDICDERGLLVWHDFMFACSAYILTDELRDNITVEARQNLKRLRNHPSLALMCGNNEIEQVFVDYRVKEDPRAVEDYIEIFEHILKDAMDELAPDVSYWPSSPSSGERFVDTGNPDKGDVHNWDVWHGSRPFKTYRRHHFRFCSEYGFEAFPNVKTIESFTKEDERNPFCRIMESHQKCWGGNGKILMYLSQTYLYPKRMETLVYASQLLQGEAIKYGVEHFRRNRGRCMGSLYWQLNDCWPTSSWSSIDYFGRWKGLHYAARNFYAPVLLSAHDNKTEITINISNETMETFTGKVIYGVYDNDNNVITESSLDASVSSLSTLDLITLQLEEYVKDHNFDRYFGYRLVSYSGEIISGGSVLLCPPKYFDFKKPEISFKAYEKDGRIFIDFEGNCFIKGIFVDFDGFDGVLSDNYFDLIMDGKKTVSLLSSSKSVTPDEVQKAIKIMSVYDMDK